ncbi:class I SAM-dependent methyltransferase [Nocardia goodfellowii]|uniref:2-polyprenyl-3-methyl-5-hydroxy-6-metoxy-1, 4-benzoquinol methylase n=1 Tax=Nocardia goodfellowii TaxID=882446 RepID=A0ABS4QKD2_9NOCA|nr:hypothetical protein [Nocardia goodfellowii]MBP2191499.1 2-polyprenyl-3-methyl-5-hydroxy-6-metoxy-1,4-benzoquinol methylase [Nocardia goodfellowii]
MSTKTPHTVLELGYGMGAYTITLARTGFRVTAVDLYHGWRVHMTLTEHAEREPESRRTYFAANKLTVCAYRDHDPGPRP